MGNEILLIAIIAAALWYDFVNGFHDAANAIATVVTTHALTPRKAILLARTLNFIGALSHTAVAYTIGRGVVDSGAVTLPILFGAVLGAIAWGYFTWYYGLPSSSTHALIGGLLGVTLFVHHFDVSVIVSSGLEKIAIVMVLSPTVGFILGYGLITALSWGAWKFPYDRTTKVFKRVQIISASFVSFTHGMNDAQNGMGVIAIALATAGAVQGFSIPLWVRIASALAIGFGTSIGGWRIIKTMGDKIANLKPIDGCSAETASGCCILLTALLGIPSSTTHNINGAIIGTAAARRFGDVNWRVVRNMATAWILTFPGAALFGIALYEAAKFIATLLRISL